MTEEQLSLVVKRLTEANETSTAEIVRTTVNGKIDRLTGQIEKHQEFMLHHAKEDKDFQDRMEPYLQGAAGLKIVRDFAIWIAGGLVAWAAIKSFFK